MNDGRRRGFGRRWALVGQHSLDLLDLVPAHRDQRRLIMRFIRWLGENPHAPGDFTDGDENLRTRQIKLLVGMPLPIGWTSPSEQ